MRWKAGRAATGRSQIFVSPLVSRGKSSAQRDAERLKAYLFPGRGGVRGAAVDPFVVRALVGDSLRADRLSALSARERQVLALAAEGHTNVCG